MLSKTKGSVGLLITFFALWIASCTAYLKEGKIAKIKPFEFLLVTAVLLILVLLSIQTDRQPQHKAFALLETPPTSAKEAQTLLGPAGNDLLRARKISHLVNNPRNDVPECLEPIDEDAQ